MDDSSVVSLEELEKFSNTTENISFSVNKKDFYIWMQNLLVKFSYSRENKRNKGILRKYIAKISGYKKAQITRLVRQYVKTGKIIAKKYERNEFKTKYSRQDIGILAKTDELHENLNGFATKQILIREFEKFGKKEFVNIKNISVSHIYNLRETKTYRQINQTYTKTKSKITNLGERKKPRPDGNPGYIRIDTVHQGDKDGEKGVYHINAVDETTQYEIVGCVEKISEKFMKPLLEDILSQYPFKIIEFHSDNGSEFVNRVVVSMLNRMYINFTKSRPRKCTDNALVESKNGSVIRKHFGYYFIDQKHAEEINEFHKNYFNIYLNFHRPCGYKKKKVLENGKIKIRYENYMTPYEKLKSLENAEQYLKPEITFAKLDEIAYKSSDNEFAEIMKIAKEDLFKSIKFKMDSFL